MEVQEIDLGFVRPGPKHRVTQETPGRGWLLWLMLAVMIGGGLALLPGEAIEPPTTAPTPVLPTPDLATTSTTLARTSVAVMSDDTFSLVPVRGLDGFLHLVGPVEFGGRYWIAGNEAYPSSEVKILSSIDGEVWEVEASVPASTGGWLRIDDLDTFEGVLMAVGTAGEVAGPSYAPQTPASPVIWKSSDGRRWSSHTISKATLDSPSLQLTAGAGDVLITEYPGPSFDSTVLDEIPSELLPGLERGDFSLWADAYDFRVVAPPGVELFHIRANQYLRASGPPRLFRSENLIIWEEIAVEFSIWNLTASPDGGFLSHNDGMRYSRDGRSWERTDRFPPLDYQGWGGDRLLGIYQSGFPHRLSVLGTGAHVTIELPTEITGNEQGLSITAGTSGLASILGSYDQDHVEPITRVDGHLLSLQGGVLRIEEPTGETAYANFDSNGLIPGSYVPETDSIRIETIDQGKTFEFPVSVFLDLRNRPQRFRFDVFVSRDGLTWASPQTGLRAGHVGILGSVDGGFLIALQNHGDHHRELPITVYRTGPPG